MDKISCTYVFVNPNQGEELKALLRKLLVEKLQAERGREEGGQPENGEKKKHK